MQIDFFSFHTTNPIGIRWSVRTRWKDSTFFIIDCVLQRRWAKALPVFAKHNRLSCVACSAGRNENRECFSNGVKSTAYIRCSWTLYDFFALGRIREQEVVLLISCWYDGAIAAFKYKRLLLYNKINRKCTGRTICNLWRKRSSIFISACWHRYQLKLWSGLSSCYAQFQNVAFPVFEKRRCAVRWCWVQITYQFPGLWRFVQFVFLKSRDSITVV